MTNSNKQRLTLMSRKEKQTTSEGGFGYSIPIETIQNRLKAQGSTLIDAAAILSLLKDRVAWIKLEPPHLERQEIAAQANSTILVLEELFTRMEHMHSDIEAVADANLPNQISVMKLWRDAEPILSSISDALTSAQPSLLAPAKTGPRRTQWHRARDDISERLLNTTNPRISKKDAHELAEDLLEICDCPNPRSKK